MGSFEGAAARVLFGGSPWRGSQKALFAASWMKLGPSFPEWRLEYRWASVYLIAGSRPCKLLQRALDQDLTDAGARPCKLLQSALDQDSVVVAVLFGQPVCAESTVD